MLPTHTIPTYGSDMAQTVPYHSHTFPLVMVVNPILRSTAHICSHSSIDRHSGSINLLHKQSNCVSLYCMVLSSLSSALVEIDLYGYSIQNTFWTYTVAVRNIIYL